MKKPHNHATDKRFLQVLAALSEAFGAELSQPRVKIYAKGLEDFPVDQIENAAWKLIRSRTTASYPKVAEIIEMIVGNVSDRAQQALATLETAIREYGYYHSVCFSDRLITAVVHQMGGWQYIYEMSDRDWTFARKDFLKMYEAYDRGGLPNSTPVYLVGFCEAENARTGWGHRKAPLQIIGDIEEGRKLLESITPQKALEN